MKCLGFFLTAALALAQPVEIAKVVAKSAARTIKLPGEFQPFETVDVHARVEGYIERINVDRGSLVKAGQLLAELSAPEMKAKIAEAQLKTQSAMAQRAEAEARLAAAQSTYDRLREAAKTPGAISGNELTLAAKAVEAARASVDAAEMVRQSSSASVDALRDLQGYLKITAPFDGVVTERFLHPGALAGPGTSALVRIEQHTRLRLVVAIPEAQAGVIPHGTRVTFTVPAFPGKTFSGIVSRNPKSMDPKTRTMPVELDVANGTGQLAPGMFPEVSWPVQKSGPSLFVPVTSIVTTTEKTFVIRVANGKAEWVGVKKGVVQGDLAEVMGELAAGDAIVKRGSDEIRNGSPVQFK